MLITNRHNPRNLTSIILLMLSLPASAAVTLSYQGETVTLAPDTLEISWQSKQELIRINQSGLSVADKAQQATEINQPNSQSAQWLLSPSNIRVEARFDGALELTFTSQGDKPERNQPATLNWFHLPEMQTQTLYLPFSEGMRIPTADTKWKKYLTEEYSGSNTTQDLKMPFWTTEQNGRYVSYQLVTATNNRLIFSADCPKADMSASHQFTALSAEQPFTVRISLGDNPLSGAHAYRQWRIDNGLAKSLSKTGHHDMSKLIGASHVYLFGTGLIAAEDVRDWWGLNDWFQTRFSPRSSEAQELSGLKKGKDWFSQYHKQLLTELINTELKRKFPVSPPTMANNTIQDQYYSARQQKAWLEKHAGKYLLPSDQWGQALTPAMLSSMQKAGLKKLWLGMDNWMPAFYQPGAVDKAKAQGYLVGTYDSYNTAIAPGINDSWLTAQLPEAMRNGCAIVKADSTLKAGFRGNGFYLNPECELDYVTRRVEDILKYGHFNSLFLDVDATAMAREDYRHGATESAMLEAFNHRMEILSQHTLLGSEDGNALTTRGIAFAHGMTTTGFGWTDKEMKTDRSSPYFLGRWYPDHKPDFFFKTAQVKEPYKTLLFSPQFRIPLYQAVFHDEVINSHHWHSDSLKFSNVQAERDLTAMLYNTPAMVHLSRDEATTANAPRLKALRHYQDGFMPLHQQLWDKSLTGFKWLDKEGWLQQTTFSDGSRIIANFSAKAQKLPNGATIRPGSIMAILSTGGLILWQSQE